MSQVVLGLRSLAIKFAIFVIMAALLAWALGGTLFPRPFIVELNDRAAWLGEDEYVWRATSHSRRNESLNWNMYVGVSGSPADQLAHTATFSDIAGPIIVNDKAVVFGGLTEDSRWLLVEIPRAGAVQEHSLPDRLAVEQQIERLRQGHFIQDEATIREQRSAVLDPPVQNADEDARPAAPGGSD